MGTNQDKKENIKNEVLEWTLETLVEDSYKVCKQILDTQAHPDRVSTALELIRLWLEFKNQTEGFDGFDDLAK